MIPLLIRLLHWIGTLGPGLRMGIAAGAWLLAFGTFAHEMWAKLIDAIDELIVPATAGSVDFSPIALANYVFPFDTLLTMVAALMALKLACAGIRIVKSFVPTVS